MTTITLSKNDLRLVDHDPGSRQRYYALAHGTEIELGHLYPYSLIYVPRGSEGRQIQHGPMVKGPWAAAYATARVIAATPLPRRRIEAEVDDLVRFPDGEVFRIVPNDAPLAGDTRIKLVRAMNRYRVRVDDFTGVIEAESPSAARQAWIDLGVAALEPDSPTGGHLAVVEEIEEVPA